MSCRFSFASLIAALTLVPLAAGCTQAPQRQAASPQPGLEPAPSSQESPSKELPRDDLGREVVLKSVPQRIVTLGPGATETVFALGAGLRLIGRDTGSDYPIQAKQVAVVADYTGLFLESVIAARPDFIIVQGETWGKARVEEWQKQCGVPVAALSANTVAEVEQGIEKIGAWLGARDKARAVTKDFPSRQKAPGYVHARAWRVFFEVQRSPLWTAGGGTLIDSVLASVGFMNVADKVRGYKPYNTETLLTDDPEFYITSEKNPNVARVVRQLRNIPGLRDLKCVRQGHVVAVPADWVLRPGPRLPQGIRALSGQVSALASRDFKAPGELRR